MNKNYLILHNNEYKRWLWWWTSWNHHCLFVGLELDDDYDDDDQIRFWRKKKAETKKSTNKRDKKTFEWITRMMMIILTDRIIEVEIISPFVVVVRKSYSNEYWLLGNDGWFFSFFLFFPVFRKSDWFELILIGQDWRLKKMNESSTQFNYTGHLLRLKYYGYWSSSSSSNKLLLLLKIIIRKRKKNIRLFEEYDDYSWNEAKWQRRIIKKKNDVWCIIIIIVFDMIIKEIFFFISFLTFDCICWFHHHHHHHRQS